MTISKVTNRTVLPPWLDDECITFDMYEKAVELTDRLPGKDLGTPILGLFGEVGSLLSEVKKKRREATPDVAYKQALEEELGDVLWYLACVVGRANLSLTVLCQRVFRGVPDWDECDPEYTTTWDEMQGQMSPHSDEEITSHLSSLAVAAGELVGHLRAGDLENNRDRLSGDLVSVLRALVGVADSTGVGLEDAVRNNVWKIFSRYPHDRIYPELADALMPENEQLPREFEIFIEEHTVNGKTYVIQKCNGLIIGDRLTDNKLEPDDYRFHDVFHIAYAVHLGWSPVLRALFRVKRKSDPRLDEAQDGARANLIEEGVSAFVFGQAVSERNLFRDIDSLDYDLLKFVHSLVKGFEPEGCALWQWERAILDGFRVFRALKEKRRGFVKANLLSHTLEFRELDRSEPAMVQLD